MRAIVAATVCWWRDRPPGLRLLMSLCVYRLVLDLSYLLLLSPAYSYSGLVLAVEPLKLIASYVLVLPILALTPTRFRRPSDFLSLILVLGVAMPVLSYYALSGQDSTHLVIMLAGIGIVLGSRHIPRSVIPRPHGAVPFVIAACWLVVVVSTILVVVRGGLSFYNLRLGDVYEYRYPAMEAVGGPVFDYWLHWIPKAILPFLLLFYTRNRRYLLTAGIAAYYMLFLAPILNAKLFIFIPVAILAAYLVLRRFRDIPGMVLALSALTLAIVAYDLTLGSGVAGSLAIRRSLFVPARLDFGYFSTFGELGHVYWSNSVLADFIDYPFHLPPANLVGEVFLGDSNNHANSGFLATGYMHWGVIGVALYSLIIGALFWLSDSITRSGADAALPACLLMVPFLSALISSDLPTSLLTHGLALALLLTWAGSGTNRGRVGRRQVDPVAAP